MTLIMTGTTPLDFVRNRNQRSSHRFVKTGAVTVRASNRGEVKWHPLFLRVPLRIKAVPLLSLPYDP